MSGCRPPHPAPVSDYTGGHLLPLDPARRRCQEDRLTIHDYLWRWDTDWFWCSRAFGAQNPRLRRLWPRRYRRSSFYWKLIGYDQGSTSPTGSRPGTAGRPGAGGRGRRGADRAHRVLAWFLANVDIEPLWLCPLRCATRAAGRCTRCRRATLCQCRLLVVGAGRAGPGHTNQLVEAKVSELDGHKSLYSDAYYGRDEFDDLYGGETYKTVKKTTIPTHGCLTFTQRRCKRR